MPAHISKHFKLEGCEIYTSCEPCPMCMGAIYWARPSKVYYAATRHDAAGAGFDDSLIYKELTAPIEQRLIEMVCLEGKKVSGCLKSGSNKPDKVDY